jgi:hypothetical protein
VFKIEWTPVLVVSSEMRLGILGGGAGVDGLVFGFPGAAELVFGFGAEADLKMMMGGGGTGSTLG